MHTSIRLDSFRTLVIEPKPPVGEKPGYVLFTIKLGGVAVGSFRAGELQCAALDIGAEKAATVPGYRETLVLDRDKSLVMEYTKKGARFALKLGVQIIGDFTLPIDKVGVLVFGLETSADEAGFPLPIL